MYIYVCMYTCTASNGMYEWACYARRTAPLPQRYICVCVHMYILIHIYINIFV